jgi:hypothetical protein
MKFAVGSFVVEKSSIRAHTSYNIQKVVAHHEGSLLVEHHGFGFDSEIHEEKYESLPGSRSWREGFQRYQENEVCTIEETKAELVRLETAKALLESEFDSITEQVRTKLEQAAQLTDEAADILVKHKKTFEDVLNESVPLYKAQKKGGWRHSTLQCKVG